MADQPLERPAKATTQSTKLGTFETGATAADVVLVYPSVALVSLRALIEVNAALQISGCTDCQLVQLTDRLH